MLSLPTLYKDAASKSVVDQINYELVIEYGVIEPKANNFNFYDDDEKEETPNTCPVAYDFQDYDLRRLVTTAKTPFSKQFVSFEQDLFRLRNSEDEESDLCFYEGENKNLNQGFVSAAVCDGFGKFEGGLKLSFKFASKLEMYGLTLNFDKISGIYPGKFRVTTNDGYGENFTCSKTFFKVIPEMQNKSFGSFDQLTVEFVEMNRPNVRARLSSVIFGIIEQFTDKDLTDTFTCEFDLDATGNWLPNQKMQFSLYDGDETYDMENPKGMYRYLTEFQPINVVLEAIYPTGAEDGAKEKVTFPVCDMLLTGNVEDKGNVVTFTGQSYLQSATGKVCTDKPTKDNGLTQNMNLAPLATGMTLYAVLEAVLYQMDMPLLDEAKVRWHLDNCLKDTNIKMTLTELKDKNLKEFVQMLAQAGRCVVYEDCRGIIHVEPRASVGNCVLCDGDSVDPEHYTFKTMFDIPQLNKVPVLEKVIVEWNGTEVASDDCRNNPGGKPQTIKNVVIDSIVFPKGADGKELGEDEKKAIIRQISNHIAYELSLRNEYTTSIRGGVELTPFDRITAETKYNRELDIDFSVIDEALDEEEKDELKTSLIKEAEKKLKNAQCAYVGRKVLTYNGAVNSEIQFYLEPEG